MQVENSSLKLGNILVISLAFRCENLLIYDNKIVFTFLQDQIVKHLTVILSLNH